MRTWVSVSQWKAHIKLQVGLKGLKVLTYLESLCWPGINLLSTSVPLVHCRTLSSGFRQHSLSAAIASSSLQLTPRACMSSRNVACQIFSGRSVLLPPAGIQSIAQWAGHSDAMWRMYPANWNLLLPTVSCSRRCSVLFSTSVLVDVHSPQQSLPHVSWENPLHLPEATWHNNVFMPPATTSLFHGHEPNLGTVSFLLSVWCSETVSCSPADRRWLLPVLSATSNTSL